MKQTYDKKKYRAVWNAACSVGQVQRIFRISRTVASNRAAYMRNCGIKMKLFKPGAKVRP